MMRAALLAIALVACTKAGGDKPGSRDDMIATWKKAGLAPSAFTPATTEVGKDCATATVNKLDVLVCTFATEQDAKAAEDKGLAWIGDATGVSRARGPVVIAVADRHRSDPGGRTINQLVTPRSR